MLRKYFTEVTFLLHFVFIVDKLIFSVVKDLCDVGTKVVPEHVKAATINEGVGHVSKDNDHERHAGPMQQGCYDSHH